MINEEETDGEPGGDARPGPPEHVPTPESRAKVESLSSSGVPQVGIATLVGLGSKNTLVKHYKEELKLGDAKFQAMIGQTASRMALGGKAEYDDQGRMVRAEVAPSERLLLFFMRTRLGLVERGARLPADGDAGDRPDVIGDDPFNVVGISNAERVARIVGLLDSAAASGAGRAADGGRAVGAVSREAARSGLPQRGNGAGVRRSGGGRQD